MLSGSSSISKFTGENIVIWLSMAFQGGAINAGGVLACHRFVTHTTGFATLFGTEIAKGHLSMAFGLLTVPLFFLMGSMISAFFVDHRLGRHQIPRYDWMFGFISFALLFIALLGNLGSFGAFGGSENLSSDYILLALLCLCSGIQNGTFTSASGAVVRTTHLTGLTTDLGIGLVRVFARRHNSELHANEKRVNWMRGGLIFSFASGSTASAFLFYRFEYGGFLGPAMISFCLMALTIRRRRLNQKLGVSNARAS